MKLNRKQKVVQFWNHKINPITGWLDQPLQEMSVKKTLLRKRRERQIELYDTNK